MKNKSKVENGEEWKCRECGVTTAPFTSHKKHKEILEAIDEINYGEVLKSNVFVKDKFEIKGKVSKLVENGEAIEEFRKLSKGLFIQGKFSQDIIELFITNALNQQRSQIVGEIEQLIQAEEQGYISVNSKTLKALLNKYKI